MRIQPQFIARLFASTPLLALGLATTLAGGCTEDPPASEPEPLAEAPLLALEGSGVAGTVTFTPVSGGVEVRGEISGLTPGMKHGFHVHEIGDCSAADGSSAGGHFDPDGMDHGPPGGTPAHVGDLGNLEADAEGRASYTFVSSAMTVGDGAATDVLGRAVIVHAGPDDLMSQPTGDAGGRIACGVIKSP